MCCAAVIPSFLFPPSSSTNGERGRIDGLEWARPSEILSMLLNVETCFEHMEMYFRAARIAAERRASLVQYHTDEEVRGALRAMHVQVWDVCDGLKSSLFEAFGVRTGSERFSNEFFRRREKWSESMRVFVGHLHWLFPKAFRGLSGAADKILLQQFKAGLSVNAVKTAVLRSRTDSFTEAIEVAAREIKADAVQEDLQPAVEIPEARAATVTTRKEVEEELAEMVRPLKHLLMTDIPAVAKRAPPQQGRRWEKKDRRTCWTCGKTVHIRLCGRCAIQHAHGHLVPGNPSEREIHVGFEGPVDVPKPAIQLETASGGKLQITNACVTEIVLGGLVTVRHIVLCIQRQAVRGCSRATFRLGSLTLFPQLERNRRGLIVRPQPGEGSNRENASQRAGGKWQPPINTGSNPNRVRRRTVHLRFGPQADEREAPHHSHRRRQASAVVPKADRPPPANAVGIPPDRNVEARRCGAVELSYPIVLLK
ncbi:hypothetical protein T03_11234 [Trichinella britovi]|uniref:Uncharacterized protein n=1 Tax=Trichinella britovi TaxID=45882 RepID=A0A0V1CKZ3_TRIBR|nr:hypothetical protein T03_11234 [Trichinella britovi]